MLAKFRVLEPDCVGWFELARNWWRGVVCGVVEAFPNESVDATVISNQSTPEPPVVTQHEAQGRRHRLGKLVRAPLTPSPVLFLCILFCVARADAVL